MFPALLTSFVVADWACTVMILYVGAGLVAGLVDLRLLDFGSLVLDFGFLGQGSPFVMIVAPFEEEAFVHFYYAVGVLMVHCPHICIYPLAWLHYIMGRSSHISVVVVVCSSLACTNFSFDTARIRNFRLHKRRCHRKDTPCASGEEPLSRRVFLSLLLGIPVV